MIGKIQLRIKSFSKAPRQQKNESVEKMISKACRTSHTFMDMDTLYRASVDVYLGNNIIVVLDDSIESITARHKSLARFAVNFERREFN